MPENASGSASKVAAELQSFQGDRFVGGGLFTNIAGSVFPREWKKWDHVGMPRRYCGTPVFVDLDEDGTLDFFYHNHYEMDPAKEWDLGLSTPSAGKSLAYKSIGDKLFVSTDKMGTSYTELPMDTHGTAILDIDRDGLLDIYIATGGGNGQDTGRKKNPVMMWGEQKTSKNFGLKQIFKGGRQAAEKCGLQNQDSRGRFTYFADFNHDGLLDMVFANEVRVDDDNRFGYAVFNKGNRSFEPHLEISEYANTMILHDADGDGHADEFVIQRARCLPMNDPETGVQAATASAKHLHFCESRLEGSTAVYKYDASSGMMKDISRPTSRGSDGRSANSMQTADFDGDWKADLAVLYEDEIFVYLSSKRSPGDLPVGVPSETITWGGKHVCLGRALRVVDLNLDGQPELLVMCAQVGNHLLLERSSYGHGTWSPRSAGLGDLDNAQMAFLTDEQVRQASRLKTVPIYLEKYRDAFLNGEDFPKSSAYGLAVVDWNNDGFMDLVLTHDVGALMMLRNDWGDKDDARGNQFIAIKLKGTVSNEYGIGATVVVQARNMGPAGKRTVQLREVNSASHEADWWGSRDDRLVFGLGKHGVVEKVTVRWPGPKKAHQVIADSQLLKKHSNSMSQLLQITEPKS
jgi:hypothetical protein